MRRTSKIAVVLLISASFSADCSTIGSKLEDGTGHAFSGTKNAALGVGCSILFIPYFGLGLVMLPFTLIDLPMSFVADIIVLPADLMKKDPKEETHHTCA